MISDYKNYYFAEKKIQSVVPGDREGTKVTSHTRAAEPPTPDLRCVGI